MGHLSDKRGKGIYQVPTAPCEGLPVTVQQPGNRPGCQARASERHPINTWTSFSSALGQRAGCPGATSQSMTKMGHFAQVTRFHSTS